jgi:hypothetical protein
LKDSIDKGIAPNSAGKHVDYLEIYDSDVTAQEMQSTLSYGASLFGHA